MSAKSKTQFKKEWLEIPEFSSWLQSVEHDVHQARCQVCFKNFDLSNMGRQSVASHAKSSKHMKNVNGTCDGQTKLLTFCRVSQNKPTTSSTVTSPESQCSQVVELPVNEACDASTKPAEPVATSDVQTWSATAKPTTTISGMQSTTP
jgi:hypothetical protein